MKKLLWVGDAGCPSGFAKATHEILDVVACNYDVTVLGINYRGDPHSYPYPIYAAAPGGDMFGIGRLIWMCDLVKPDVIVLQNDPWNIPLYLKQLARFPEYAKVPVVGIVAVDGNNCPGDVLNGLTRAIFWTTFGAHEAAAGGYTGPCDVVPLGVDTDVFRPIPKEIVRARRLPDLQDAFIVGNVNRNQPRKRWDLTVKYFAEWVHARQLDNAYLYLHVAPTGDTGVDVKQLAQYYGVVDKILLVEPQVFYGIDEREMVDTYNCFDVCISTTQGEGFGLTTLEAMACGVPCIVPDWSALGDWAAGAARMVPCTSTAIGPPYVNVIGGVPDEELFIRAINDLYGDSSQRLKLGQLGLDLARQQRFNWAHIGQQFSESIDGALLEDREAVWQDLGRPEVASA